MSFIKYTILLVFSCLLLGGCSPKNHYEMTTDLGSIRFKVYPNKAPITVSNFIKYLERQDFEGATFYRSVRMDNQPNDSVKIEVIQGNFVSFEKRLEPIVLESTKTTKIRHKNGTLSMARAQQPNSASAAFFICLNDQPALDFGGKRNKDGLGFAAFGKVTQGMDIVKEIQHGETEGQSLKQPVVIKDISKVK